MHTKEELASIETILKSHLDAITRHGRMKVDAAWHAGRELRKAKELVGHGGWLPWLRKQGLPQRTANDYMTLAESELADFADFRSLADAYAEARRLRAGASVRPLPKTRGKAAHSAPFPWPDGKRRWAHEMLQRFGDVDTYVEPFAGSLAVLLHKPEPFYREIVCDTDGMICNFWRALRNDPDAVAQWAAYPTIHQDLTARHKWLRSWKNENAGKLSDDPDYYDAKVAGWWVWGVSNWIGGGFCAGKPGDQRPFIGLNGGMGVQARRGALPVVHDKRPYVRDAGGGRGVQAQCSRAADLTEWFGKLAARLEKVVVLNRSWESAMTPSILGDTLTSPGVAAVFLDPPYLTANRTNLYGSDADGTSDDTAHASYAWAVANGERHRIAYACGEGDFEVPDGWTAATSTFAGISDPARRGRLDMVMFSPACVQVEVEMREAA